MNNKKSASYPMTSRFSFRCLVALCLLAVGQARADTAVTPLEPEMGFILANAIQNTGDAKANRLAAHMLKNSVYRPVNLTGGASPSGYQGLEISPASNSKLPDYSGGRRHTQLRIFVPAQGIGSLKPPSRKDVLAHAGASQTPVSGLPWNTPASLACVYGLVQLSPGCIPDTAVADPAGGSGVIAVIDAYDTPATVTDLANFSRQFGLPAAQFKIVYASGNQPQSSYTAADQGWDMEAELDVQWAHAMAPGARIFLVEADSDSDDDLYAAVDAATSIVQQNGGGVVSMSFGGNEYAEEIVDDAHFAEKAGVVYTASTGDSNMVSYPAASPHVFAVGGTTITRDSSNAFVNEVVWNDVSAGNGGTGGGPSYYEPRPVYQNGVSSVVRTTRGVPDASFNASVSSGVWVLAYGYWNIVGGTSLGSPATAGLINVASTLSKSLKKDTTQTQLAIAYNALASSTYSSQFRDITSGTCGTELFPPSTSANLAAATGYDLCSGIGVPLGYVGYGATPGSHPAPAKPYLENIGSVGGTITIIPAASK